MGAETPAKHGHVITDQEREHLRKLLLSKWHGGEEYASWREKVLRALSNSSAARRGQPLSGEHRRKVSHALQGRRFSPDAKRKMSEAKGGIIYNVRPLFLRGLTASEVSWILGEDVIRVKNALDNLRVQNLAPQSSKEETRRAKQIARQKDAMTQEQRVAYAVVGYLVQDGYFGDDLSYKTAVELLYRQEKRPLPDETSRRMVLEAFFQAYVAKAKGQTAPMVAFMQATVIQHPDWYAAQIAGEENFIVDNIGGSERYFEDGSGYFRIVNGGVFRPIEFVGGAIVYDSSLHAQERERVRNQNNM